MQPSQAAAEDAQEDPFIQRVAQAGEIWIRTIDADRQGIVARASGLNHIQRKNVATQSWAKLNSDIQRKLAQVQQAQAATENVANISTKEGAAKAQEAAQDENKGADPAAVPNFPEPASSARDDVSAPSSSSVPPSATHLQPRLAVAQNIRA